MPEMDLFGPELHLALISGVWTRIWAYMLWPTDESARNAYRARPFVTALASIERKGASGRECPDDYERAQGIVYGSFRETLGWSALVEGNRQLQGNGRRLRTAAAILDIVRKIPAAGGSLNKAVHVIETTANNYNLVRNRTSILATWKNHKASAHLGIALLYSGEFREIDFEDPRRLRRFLAIARDYQQFAASYKAPRQHDARPLVDATAMWTVPADLKLPRANCAGALPPDMLTALSKYQAPL